MAFDGETLTIYALAEGSYRPQRSSTVLPLLSQGDLLRFLQESQIVGETTWVKGFRQWLRAKLEAQ